MDLKGRDLFGQNEIRIVSNYRYAVKNDAATAAKSRAG